MQKVAGLFEESYIVCKCGEYHCIVDGVVDTTCGKCNAKVWYCEKEEKKKLEETRGKESETQKDKEESKEEKERRLRRKRILSRSDLEPAKRFWDNVIFIPCKLSYKDKRIIYHKERICIDAQKALKERKKNDVVFISVCTLFDAYCDKVFTIKRLMSLVKNFERLEKL